MLLLINVVENGEDEDRLVICEWTDLFLNLEIADRIAQTCGTVVVNELKLLLQSSFYKSFNLEALLLRPKEQAGDKTLSISSCNFVNFS